MPDRYNISIVSNSSCEAGGGLAAYLRWLGISLQSRGNHVQSVTRFKGNGASGVNHADAETPGPVEGTPFPTEIIAPPAWIRPALKNLPSLLSRPPLRPFGIALYNLGYGGAVARAISPAAQVVHVIGTGWDMLGFAVLKEARRRNIPVTVHPAIHPKVWGDDALDIDFYKQVDTVFAQTHHEKQYLIDKGVRAENIRVRGLAPCVLPDGSADRFRKEHNLGNRPLILFVARRVAYKGFPALVEAMPAVLKAVPDACLVLMSGPGDPIQNLPEGSILELVGASDAVKADALAACDIVCVPSTDESFGIVYVEGWLYRKPVIGGPAPAVEELIEQGVTGYTVPQQPGAIAEKIIQLLENANLRQDIGQAGFARQQKDFTWESVADDYLTTFEEVIARHK